MREQYSLWFCVVQHTTLSLPDWRGEPWWYSPWGRSRALRRAAGTLCPLPRAGPLLAPRSAKALCHVPRYSSWLNYHLLSGESISPIANTIRPLTCTQGSRCSLIARLYPVPSWSWSSSHWEWERASIAKVPSDSTTKTREVFQCLAQKSTYW